MNILLSTAYMGNIRYFSKLSTGRALIEAHENFQKQSYRNHCRIMTACGVKLLTVPIARKHNEKIPVRQVRIDYSLPWQRTHWRTIRAAYASSPYFAHYADRIEDMICGRKHEFLFDLNTFVTTRLLEVLKIDVPVSFTDEYAASVGQEYDFRNTISSKPRLARPDPCFSPPEYYQVFGETLSFEPDLSALDIIFCEGPSAGEMINNSFTNAI